MAYFDSNAAYAYDYMAQPSYAPERRERTPERPMERPQFDVVTGAGREANQIVSPAFTYVAKAFICMIALVAIVGFFRVNLAGRTSAMMNANAELTASLEAAHDESSNLEVMNTVYGAETRIRDLATGALGMVEPEDSVTLDLSESTHAEGQEAGTQASDPASETTR